MASLAFSARSRQCLGSLRTLAFGHHDDPRLTHGYAVTRENAMAASLRVGDGYDTCRPPPIPSCAGRWPDPAHPPALPTRGPSLAGQLVAARMELGSRAACSRAQASCTVLRDFPCASARYRRHNASKWFWFHRFLASSRLSARLASSSYSPAIRSILRFASGSAIWSATVRASSARARQCVGSLMGMLATAAHYGRDCFEFCAVAD